MNQSIKIRVSNPAGNITIFVMENFERNLYQKIATQLLAMEDFKAEQVAFVKSKYRMEMCGLEFCGNASRSFALISAIEGGISGSAKITIEVSGCDTPLVVDVDTKTNYTKIKMPYPTYVKEINDCPFESANGQILVNMDGITHVILRNVPASRETFDIIKNYIIDKYDPPAVGVMFYDDFTSSMTPVVYVKNVDTTYFEGSCASGSTAMAVELSRDKPKGLYSYDLIQPAGILTTTAEVSDDCLKAIYIEGPVEISDEIVVEVEI